MAVTLDTTVVRDSEWLSTEVADEMVVMSPARGTYVTLNATGREVWGRLESPQRVDALCAELERTRDAPPETIRADVLAFLNEMFDAGLIVVP